MILRLVGLTLAIVWTLIGMALGLVLVVLADNVHWAWGLCLLLFFPWFVVLHVIEDWAHH
jgi:hypothetical protein